MIIQCEFIPLKTLTLNKDAIKWELPAHFLSYIHFDAHLMSAGFSVLIGKQDNGWDVVNV